MKRVSAATSPVRQRGMLIGLTVLFVGSGILRIGELNMAIAATDDQANEASGTMGMQEWESCPNIESVTTALTAIEGRAEELDAREAAISERQSQLEAADRLITARLEDLEAAETRLDEMLSLADTAAASDIDQLVAFYEAMGPEEAAELFAEMDPSFAAGFLSRMRPESGAGVLSELEPDQAYAISVILATRNADVPRSMQGTNP